MANNAIALQVRAPQSNPLGNIVQQNAQLINMMTQQRAAEAERAQRQAKMEQDTALFKQQEAKGALDLTSAEQKAISDFLNLSYKGIKAAQTPEDVMFLAQGLKQRFNNPLFHTMVDQTISSMPSDPAKFSAWKDKTEFETADSAVKFEYKYPKVNTEVVIGAGGRPAVVTRGGLNAPNIVYPETYELDPNAAPPPRAGKVDLGPQITVDSDQGGIYEVPPAGSPQAETSVGVPQMAPDATPMRIVVDGAKMLGAIIDEPNPAKREADYQLFLTSLDKTAPQLAQLIRENAPTFNLQYANEVLSAAKDYIANPQGDGSTRPAPSAAQPVGNQGDFPLVEGPRGGPYEGYRRAAPFVAKDPSVGQYPGSALVPLPRVAAEAAAGRPGPGEVYLTEKARLKAQREAAENAGPKPLTAQQEQQLRSRMARDFRSAQTTIDTMINPKTGIVARISEVRRLSPDQKEAITGWSGYAPSLLPSSRSADTAIKNLKGMVTEMGKNVAALSGSIGNMAVQEWKIVSDMIGSLDLEGMNAKDLDTQLDIIEARARRAAEVTMQAYNDQYAEDFARYPGRFQLKVPAAPAANRRPPPRQTKTGVDYNNPLLR